ncbi:MAG: LptF/LptG family permease [Phenylobacterium sp.]|uniref:LptF/LptG family permease n=1 Tax=Phenylobacterium sp. TaxID=1871053 RepID=UPI0025D0E116|nr:LptF/LptG family permease [Phenylobacterium sp.]MBI1196708.1 LptF/LptG family permease [Phenylobacterium sp.]
MTLGLYLARLMATRVLAALAVLVGVLQILDLLEVTTEILDRKLGAAGVAYYALLRLPRLIEQAAPLAALAGSLFAFAKLAGDSAVTAMRSTGISVYRITLTALPVVLALTLTQLAIGLVVAPRTDSALSAWWQANTPPETTREVDPITFRIGEQVVVATPRDPDGRSLEKVTIYQRDARGRLEQRINAPTAVFDGESWRLIDPKFETVGASVAEGSATQMDWTQRLRPSDVRALAAGETTVTPAEAKRALGGGLSIRPRSFYDTQLQRAWAAPMACLVMLLLAAPGALANFRGGGTTLMVQCLAAGLLFLVFDGAFTALGESGAAPPVLAAWAAPAMFAALGVTALVYLEG